VWAHVATRNLSLRWCAVDRRLAEGLCPPTASINLPLDDAPLVACLLGAIINVGEAFWRMGLVGERSECWDSDFNENTSLWWRYAIYRTVDLTLQAKGGPAKNDLKCKDSISKQT